MLDLWLQAETTGVSERTIVPRTVIFLPVRPNPRSKTSLSICIESRKWKGRMQLATCSPSQFDTRHLDNWPPPFLTPFSAAYCRFSPFPILQLFGRLTWKGKNKEFRLWKNEHVDFVEIVNVMVLDRALNWHTIGFYRVNRVLKSTKSGFPRKEGVICCWSRVETVLGRLHNVLQQHSSASQPRTLHKICIRSPTSVPDPDISTHHTSSRYREG